MSQREKELLDALKLAVDGFRSLETEIPKQFRFQFNNLPVTVPSEGFALRRKLESVIASFEGVQS
jgi:hypothetical protein